MHHYLPYPERMALIRASSKVAAKKSLGLNGLSDINWGDLITGTLKTAASDRLATIQADAAAAKQRELIAAQSAAETQSKLTDAQIARQAADAAAARGGKFPIIPAAIGGVSLLALLGFMLSRKKR